MDEESIGKRVNGQEKSLEEGLVEEISPIDEQEQLKKVDLRVKGQ